MLADCAMELALGNVAGAIFENARSARPAPVW
jgi:hypothetical protein